MNVSSSKFSRTYNFHRLSHTFDVHTHTDTSDRWNDNYLKNIYIINLAVWSFCLSKLLKKLRLIN